MRAPEAMTTSVMEFGLSSRCSSIHALGAGQGKQGNAALQKVSGQQAPIDAQLSAEEMGALPRNAIEDPLERHQQRGARTNRHKEIREPAPLQHRDQHLRDARRPRSRRRRASASPTSRSTRRRAPAGPTARSPSTGPLRPSRSTRPRASSTRRRRRADSRSRSSSARPSRGSRPPTSRSVGRRRTSRSRASPPSTPRPTRSSSPVP